MVTGYLRGPLDLDPGPDVFELTTQTFATSYIARYESDGDFDYAFLFSEDEIVDVIDMSEGRYGEAYFVGEFNNTVKFDPAPGANPLVAVGTDIFIAKYNLDGSFRWAHSLRGDGTDEAGGLAIRPNGEIILVGGTEERTDFNIGTGTDTLPWNGYLQSFVARYDQCISVYPDSQSICHGETYTLGSQVLSTPGNYVATFPVPGGCDSIRTLQLNVTTVDTAISLQGFDLVSSAAAASWQWIDCNTSQAIVGATAAIFTPTVPGDYAVIVTENGCSDTSACVSVTTVGRTDPSELGLMRVYPNPAEDVLYLEFPKPVKLASIQLLDLTGRASVAQRIDRSGTNVTLQLPDIPTGMYLLAVEFADGSRQVGRVWVE